MGKEQEIPVELVDIEKLRLAEPNPNEGDVGAITQSIEANDWYGVVVANKRKGVETENMVLVGNHRMMAAQQLGHKQLPVWWVDKSDIEARRLMVADNRTAQLANTDQEQMAALLTMLAENDALLGSGYDGDDLDLLLADMERDNDAAPLGAAGNLRAQFLCPPLTTMDARQGWWRERKRWWLGTGIVGELGRDNNLLGLSNLRIEKGGLPGTSIFDPVLCELAYRWFSPEGGTVLDPFAGGSVRGVVAAALQRNYCGIDLADGQVKANRQQWELVGPNFDEAVGPTWHMGDSLELLAGDDVIADSEADLLFTCPPYFDLERYSDDAADLSAMDDYPSFLDAYERIIALAAAKLADDRFAVIVVGDVRDKNGIYRGLVPDTVRACEQAGLHYYNEGVLITPVNSVAFTAARTFRATRKLGKCHQNVLVFVKGDPRKATEHCGPVVIPDIEADEE